MTVRILQGDRREVLKTLPDASVQCVVTKPKARPIHAATWLCPHCGQVSSIHQRQCADCGEHRPIEVEGEKHAA